MARRCKRPHRTWVGTTTTPTCGGIKRRLRRRANDATLIAATRPVGETTPFGMYLRRASSFWGRVQKRANSLGLLPAARHHVTAVGPINPAHSVLSAALQPCD